jgi:hypothetical protein
VVVREANSPLTSANSPITLASKVSNLELVEAILKSLSGCSPCVVWIHLAGEGFLGCEWWPFENEGVGEGKWVHGKNREMIYMTVIRVKRGMQWDRCQIRVSGRVGGTTKKFFFISDRYHNDQVKRGVQWDGSQIRVSGRGSGPKKKIGLKMIGTTVIRVKRGIQWDRSQIRVSVGPLYSFFFLLMQSYTPT